MQRVLCILLLFIAIISSTNNVQSQSVPFPSPEGRNYNALEPYGYDQVGTTWDTSPYLPFIYHGMWFRLMPPNGVTYNRNTKTWTFSEPGKKYPIILFFHGRGEVGQDNNKQLIHGGQIHRDAVLSNKFPGFLLYPQSIGYVGAKDILEKVLVDLPVDINRIYVHGLSNGGAETWKFTVNYPQLVAASFPMSASDDNAKTENLLYMPIRQAQGGLDTNPDPDWTQTIVNWFNTNGGHLEYFLLPSVGHGTWNNMYNRTDFFPWFLSKKKNQIFVRYKRNEICPSEPISVVMGFTPGFEAYEWRKDGVVISGANTYKITATSYGIYTGRFRHRGVWTDWSDPVEVKIKAPTQTPSIQLAQKQSVVIPDANGNSNVTLTLPDGYQSYAWYKQGVSETIAVTQSYVASTPGVYTATANEFGGCSSIPSPAFNIYDANGPQKPDAVLNFQVSTFSKTELRLNWENNVSPTVNETGFEIYRSLNQDGPFELLTVTAADVLSYADKNLESNTWFYYKVRAITNNGASDPSPVVGAMTDNDITPPTAPNNLTLTSISTTSAGLQWSASTDDVGVVGYDIFVRKHGETTFVKAYSTTATSLTVFQLTPNTLYNFIVKAKDDAGNFSQPSQQIVIPTVFSGVNYTYYHGSWTSLPDFTALTPVKTGTLSNFSNSPRTQNDNHGFRFTGTIYIPTTGQYTFYLTSKDGSRLWINGNLIVDHDGIHASSEKSGNVTLNQGYYPIEVRYFESTGNGETIQVRWQGPSISKQTIPNINLRDAFTQPAAPAAPATPTLTVLDYKSIRVNWTAYSGTGTDIEVYRSTNNSSWNIIATVPATQVNYVDPKLNPSTRYYYRLRAINSGNVSGFTNSVFANTQALPALPAAPSLLQTTAIAATSVSLKWNDNSTNEENFDIYKSAGNNTSYTKLVSLPAGTTQYTDNTLFAHTKYYYRVQSKNVRGTSAFSNEITFTSLNNAPVLTAPANIIMRFDEQKSIVLTAVDPDNDLIIIGGNNLPGFAQLYDYAEGTGELYLAPLESDQGSYNLELFAQDTYGGLHTFNVNLVINDNHAPIVDPIAPVSLKESYVTKVNVTASDADNEVVTWTLENAPLFILPTINGNSVELKIQPGTSDAGTYNVNVRATDAQGASDVKTLSITVTEYDPNFKVLVNFTRGNTLGPAPWNNIVGGGTVRSYTLNKENGGGSGISLFVQNAWSDADVNGTTSPAPSLGMPSSVTSSFFWFQAGGNTRTLLLTGLNPDGKYKLKFFPSRNSDSSPVDRLTTFSVPGFAPVSVQATANTSATADFTNVAPNASGEILITVSRNVATNGLAILNAMVIESFFDGNVVPPTPTNLVAAPDPSSNIRVTWNDVASNEQSYELYKSTDNVNFSLHRTLPINSVSFTDTEFTKGITYYYKVRAVNGIGASAYSNTASIVGPNKAPVILPLTPLTIEEFEGKMVLVEATDAENDEMTFSLENEPGFVSMAYYENGKIYLTIAPSEGVSGFYQFLIHCDDINGARATATFSLTVKTVGEFEVKVNFSASSTAIPGWNIFTGSGANASLSNLRDVSNNTTSISLLSQNAWSGTGTGGYTTGNNSGTYPDAVMSSYFFASDNGNRNIVVSGLKPDKQYDFSFFASRAINDATVRNVRFTIGAKTVTVNATNNTATLAKLTNVKAPGGQVTVTIAKDAASPFAYINAMVIREYADPGLPVPPAAPSNLTSQVMTRSSIKLNWQDGSDNETGFEIWRSVGSNTGYELLTSVGPNVTTFTNTALANSTVYYYQVRAVNAQGVSAYSNETTASTFDYSVSINFNSFRGNQSGWNNLPTYLRNGQSVANLTDELGLNTGITMTVVDEFAGDNPYGMTTGNESGIVPDKVMEGSWWIDPRGVATLRFSNLSFLRKYNFSFFASRAAGGDRTTKYIINGVEVLLNASLNTSNMVQIKDVVPDANGTITVTITTTLSAQFGYLNGLIIQAVPVNLPGGRLKPSEHVQADIIGEGAHAVEAYPNPFTNKITVNLGSIEGPVKTSLIDITGSPVFEQTVDRTGRIGELELEVGDKLSQGVYILTIRNQKGISRTIKLSKK